ncbi:MAG TPA: hypothetical protein PLW31_10480 [Bacteroidales bacterium]|nr:hypothetical protein [Bacteroidales bacterium]HOX78449.1 hypothetical protein [Bacteroidales bacterium]HPM93869.1 hypothetical protein [Bacteroidales bacterium]
MKTKALYECIDFLTKWKTIKYDDHIHETYRDAIYGEKYVEPFRRELNKNLVFLNQTKQNKVIKFYITELIRQIDSEFILSKYKTQDSEESGTLEIKDEAYLKEKEEKYSMADAITYLNMILFFELQMICRSYNIPVKKIIDEANIDLDKYYFIPALKKFKGFEESFTLSIRPRFTAEYIPQIFEFLKDFFDKRDQPEFLTILETGEDAYRPLLFIDKGSRLADVFKQLFSVDIIRGCQKKELEAWICKNFRYRSGKTIKIFTKRYVSDVISSNQVRITKPILDLKLDKTTGQYLITKL